MCCLCWCRRGDEVRLEELYPALQEIIVAGNDPVVDVPSSVASIELASSSSSTPAPTSTIIEETVTSPSTTTVASPIPVASPTPNTNNQEKVEDNQEKVEDNQDKISISKQLAHTQVCLSGVGVECFATVLFVCQ